MIPLPPLPKTETGDSMHTDTHTNTHTHTHTHTHTYTMIILLYITSFDRDTVVMKSIMNNEADNETITISLITFHTTNR